MEFNNPNVLILYKMQQSVKHVTAFTHLNYLPKTYNFYFSFSRLSIWLGSRLRRDLDSVSVEKTEESEHFVRPEDIRDTLLPHSR